MLATEVENPKQSGLGALDITIRRNAYGRQLDSSIREGKLLPARPEATISTEKIKTETNKDGNKKREDSPLEMVFIRAPKIERIGPNVKVLATEGADPVAVRQGTVMAATFHPELSDDPRVHQAFLDLCGTDTPFGKLRAGSVRRP